MHIKTDISKITATQAFISTIKLKVSITINHFKFDGYIPYASTITEVTRLIVIVERIFEQSFINKIIFLQHS